MIFISAIHIIGMLVNDSKRVCVCVCVCVKIPVTSLLLLFVVIYLGILVLPITNIMGAFTLDVKSVLNENLGGILGGTWC